MNPGAFPGEFNKGKLKKMNQEEYLKQLTPKGFLDNFAGILIATYQKSNKTESDPNYVIEYDQDVFGSISIIARSICSEKENASYLTDLAIPEKCKENNLSDRDIDVITAGAMFSVIMNREQQEEFVKKNNLDFAALGCELYENNIMDECAFDKYFKQLSAEHILYNYAGLITCNFLNAEELVSSKKERDLTEAVCIVRSVLFNNFSEEEALEKTSYLYDQLIPEMCKKNNIPENHVNFIRGLAFSVLLDKEEIDKFEQTTHKKLLRVFDFQK